MEIKNIRIDNLKEAGYNPRQMNAEDLEKLKYSVKEFGVVEPIVVNKDLTVIGGHQRLKVLQELDWKEVPCIILDLDKKREKLLNLALNRIIGNWDEEKLAKLVKEISDYPDIKLSGLNESELEMLNVQYDLIFENENIEFDSEEEVKKLFELNTRVPIDLERPNIVKQKGKVAFYTENFEEWKKIKEHFSAKNKSELDTKKLLNLI